MPEIILTVDKSIVTEASYDELVSTFETARREGGMFVISMGTDSIALNPDHVVYIRA